ncbi:hypothetical protein [Janthinobacterium sp. PC23-8]|uniref:hypothetical protein n=1 Tax=Janthinobacterium sp. PC23-8 TaxID=2012679 RepID=UPI0020CEED73|nr:hypothetical protein [Janthinobacterium sp. PC23-8]
MNLSTPARVVLLFSACLWSAAVLAAGDGAGGSDKIATDRPDFVESSNVVGKYRFQIETSVAQERNKARSTSAAPTC